MAWLSARCRVLVIAAVLAAASCGDSTRDATSDADARLVFENPPTGFELCEAVEGSPFGVISAGAPTIVWGDRSLSDPWDGPMATASISKGDTVPVHDVAVPVTVRGREGYVGDAQFFQGVSSHEWGSFVTWAEKPGVVVEVQLKRGSAADAVRLAGLAVVSDTSVSFPADALGTRTEIVASGPSLFAPGGFNPQRWSVTYEAQDDGTGVAPNIAIFGLDGGREMIDVMRYWAVYTEPLVVRGATGILYSAWSRSDGPWGALWQEPDGQMIQVAGYATEQQTRAALQSIAPKRGAAWSQLSQLPGHCALS